MFGKNRSQYLARYLNSVGHDADFGGVAQDHDEIQNKIDVADMIVAVSPDIHVRLMNDFKIDDKRTVELNVDDRPEIVLPAGKQLDGDDWVNFQERYVYPKLLEQLKGAMGDLKD
ncbi:hypothetical protein HQ524_04480 [Candidatus Uhrbacteria bacterium]|nr:hypothetical protein [Candidatus Uhrbacteria bacterium]